MARRNKERVERHMGQEGGRGYAPAGLPCSVDTKTGRVVAQALRLRLACVPVEDAKSMIHDRYYCDRHSHPNSCG